MVLFFKKLPCPMAGIVYPAAFPARRPIVTCFFKDYWGAIQRKRVKMSIVFHPRPMSGCRTVAGDNGVFLKAGSNTRAGFLLLLNHQPGVKAVNAVNGISARPACRQQLQRATKIGPGDPKPGHRSVSLLQYRFSWHSQSVPTFPPLCL
jgi:hypothetical protein